MNQKTAIIIGAGPAGLTAAHELLEKTDIKPIILEATNMVGGIARTVNYKGNRIDLGGHRFFSKSDTVMEWWLKILPLQYVPDLSGNSASSGPREGQNEANVNSKFDISYRGQKRSLDYLDMARDPADSFSPDPALRDPDKTDRVMLVRNRLSRIFYLRKFFSYPVSLNMTTVSNLGLLRMLKIGSSYLKTRLFPLKQEKTLEDFFINRFGNELYLTFFKDYTEKVWGVPCNLISAEWGAQRVKGLSVSKALIHALKQLLQKDSSIDQKKTETSLIERFLYPKHGPGQLWEEVASQIRAKGGEIRFDSEVVGIDWAGQQVKGVTYRDHTSSQIQSLTGDYVFSTMPVRDLIEAMGENVPPAVKEVSAGLMYRDFITVGLLLKELKVKHTPTSPAGTPSGNPHLIPDNWIYIQERDVKVGRLQIFNNWSPYMVNDRDKIWLGLEYFCNEGDELWNMADDQFISFATNELAKIDIINKEDVLDSVLIRQKKTYPAYFGTYNRFDTIKEYTDMFDNLFLIGRNGMHKYNNQDHSMLTAMTAVENIRQGIVAKENIWSINTEEEYHEAKKE